MSIDFKKRFKFEKTKLSTNGTWLQVNDDLLIPASEIALIEVREIRYYDILDYQDINSLGHNGDLQAKREYLDLVCIDLKKDDRTIHVFGWTFKKVKELICGPI